MRAGARKRTHCGEILRDLFARDGRDPDDARLRVEPAWPRARLTMELARTALGLAADGYRLEQALTEISFGDWEGFTIAQLRERDPQRLAAREHDKWHFLPPGGESYQMVRRACTTGTGPHARRGSHRAWRHRARADGRARHRQAGGGAAHSISSRAWSMYFEGESLTRYA